MITNQANPLPVTRISSRKTKKMSQSQNQDLPIHSETISNLKFNNNLVELRKLPLSHSILKIPHNIVTVCHNQTNTVAN